MLNIEILLEKNKELHINAVEAKLWLLAKEQVEYQNYLDSGGNARTARDKVITELVNKDIDNWYEKTVEYEKLKINVKSSDDLLQIVKGLVNNDKEEIAEKLIESLESN